MIVAAARATSSSVDGVEVFHGTDVVVVSLGCCYALWSLSRSHQEVAIIVLVVLLLVVCARSGYALMFVPPLPFAHSLEQSTWLNSVVFDERLGLSC